MDKHGKWELGMGIGSVGSIMGVFCLVIAKVG